jgi:hypothetical protein
LGCAVEIYAGHGSAPNPGADYVAGCPHLEKYLSHAVELTMSTTHIGGRTFEMERELIEVTSMSRADPNWSFTDPAGHLHQWWQEKPFRPMTDYSPNGRYIVPGLRWVEDEKYWEDEDWHTTGHWECRKCGAEVRPGTCADTHTQYMAGITSYRIEGRLVSKPEFERQLTEAKRGL